MSLFRDFHQALGEALAKLDEVKGIQDQADTAERRLANARHDLAALIDSHASMRADSDALLAANRKKMADDLSQHQVAIDEMKKNQARLADLHKSQEEAASSTLTAINMDIARKLKLKDELAIQVEQMKTTIHDLAAKL